MNNTKLAQAKQQTIEIGTASQLTQGAERHNYEWGRPGYPKGGRYSISH